MWTSLDWRILTTRAPHDCAGCWRTFPPGVEMRVSVGMWNGDPPNRVYYCLVCDSFIENFRSDDSFPNESWITLYDHGERYAKTEAGLSDYIEASHVPTSRDWIALREMYHELRIGERWREWDKRR